MKLPDFTRWAWASLAEREWYAPRIQEAAAAFQDLERISVAEGLRPAAWKFVPADQLVGEAEWSLRNGVICIPVSGYDERRGEYSTTLDIGPTTGTPKEYRCLYVHPSHYNAKLFPLTDEKLGEILGYPTCCQASFADTWKKGQVDSTYEQLIATKGQPGLSNTLWRHMGVRLVPHMPCSFSCEASEKLAADFYALGVKHGYVEEMLFLKEMINWPLRWSRRIGIAEYISDGFKMMARTDYTPTLQSIDVPGSYVPVAATLWKDNGFDSAAGMRAFHYPLITAMKEFLPQGARIIDLGCGNGHLLRRLTIHRPDVKIAGIDLNEDAISRTPMLNGKWWVGHIEGVEPDWSTWQPTAANIMPGRLTEMTDEEAERTRQRLAKIPVVFVHAFNDWLLTRSLEELCQQAKLPAVRMIHKTPDVQVGVIVNT